MRNILLKILFFLLPFGVQAQYYIVGQDPANIKWRQINTPNFQLIYPSHFESNAHHMANILEDVYQFANKTLKHQPQKISVILHTQTVRSNGFAAWAPARVEMFTAPHQDIYAQDWLEQLAIHEFRHVVQIDKIGSELPKIFKVLLGEQAASIAIGAYLPFWFLEGDAVTTETALSLSGRGRLPSFEMELRAQIDKKGLYGYDKAYLGSYRDYIPDYYQLGYQIVAGARDKYGEDFWAKVLHNVAKKPLSINAFTKGIRNITGNNVTGLYEETVSRLEDRNKPSTKIKFVSKVDTISNKTRNYTSYQFPFFINDSVYISYKNSINDIGRFLIINNKGNEKTLFTPGAISQESVTYKKNKLIWFETNPDSRWIYRESSLLRILDIENGHLFEKRYSEKLYVPQLSPDGKMISAVKTDSQNNSYLVLISPENGELLNEFKIPEQQLLLTPSWTEDSKTFIAVLLGKKGKSLVRFSPFTNEIEHLTPFSFTEIKKPFQHSNTIYFTSNLNGIDNGYAINLTNNKLYQITDSKFGIKDLQLSENAGKLIFSDYTADGFKIVNQMNDSDFRKERSWTEKATYPLAEKIASQESVIDFDLNRDTTNYRSKRYPKLKNLFNFHSWSPAYVDADNEDIQPGFSLMSQNKLSTAVTQLGYKYSTADETGKWIAKFSYSGFYPIFELTTEYGKGKSQYFQITKYQNQIGEVVRTDTSLVRFTYDQLYLEGGIKIPINLAHGKMYRLLQPEIQVGYTKIWQQSNIPKGIFRGTVIPFTYRLYAHNLLRQSYRDLQPRLGQIIDLQYRHTPTGNRDLGNIWSAENVFYLPGFAKSHGIRAYAAIQQKSADQNMFSDLINYPRGYPSIMNKQMFTFRTDYALPLLYPDLSLSKLIYIKRLSTRLFYDYASAQVPVDASQNVVNYPMSSIGGELNIDCHFFRFIAPVKIGFRESYLIERKSSKFEALFSINLSDI